MQSLILYSTLGCHLCDLAKNVIANSCSAQPEWVDIAEDEELLALYGTRIPVVKARESNREIGWPFDEARFEQWYNTL
ncbi:glutaredoxin family protein [Teredinibacter haidensis]|uniref:glutaredoxin family protein n=1 Tax=Teredinibacter haidensis TaxID=2731755 RepID=UPI00094892F9|nr:glutaredoxin family protein [Teredinibacter haidensis]